MNIVFYVLMTLTAIYAIFNIVDFSEWWLNVIKFVPVKIWNFVKSIFKKE